MALARAAARLMRGRSADATRRAGKRAVEQLIDLVQPWALEAWPPTGPRADPWCWPPPRPMDLVDPLADALGFDDVIATRYQEIDGRYTGRLDGGFVWGTGQAGRRGPVGGPTTASTWPPPTPTRTASSTCRC